MCSPVIARNQSFWLIAQPSKSAAHREKVESGTFQSKSGTSVNLSNSGFPCMAGGGLDVDVRAPGLRGCELSLLAGQLPGHYYPARSRANMAHVRQSRPDSGLDFQAKVIKTFKGVPSSLESDRCDSRPEPLVSAASSYRFSQGNLQVIPRGSIIGLHLGPIVDNSRTLAVDFWPIAGDLGPVAHDLGPMSKDGSRDISFDIAFPWHEFHP